MQIPLIIPATKSTPNINFDNNTGIFTISGRSLPEDVIKFYKPVKEWVDIYVQNPNENTKIILDLNYFNSSTARLLVKIIIEFENISKKGKNVKVIWKYKAGDEVMEERGYEIKSVVFLPFEFEEYS